MNRIQKMAWMTVICTGTGLILSIVAVTILYFTVGFPRAEAGLAFISLAGFAGLAPLIFRKDPGPVQADERDRIIQVQSIVTGYGVGLYGVWQLFHYSP